MIVLEHFNFAFRICFEFRHSDFGFCSVFVSDFDIRILDFEFPL